MGEVWLLQEINRGFEICLKQRKNFKTTNIEFTTSEGFKRFVQEAIILANLEFHPNIVSFIGIETTSNELLLLMEYVKGKDLRTILQDVKHDWKIILSLAIQIASGISFAHKSGLIHRDLKPENILIAEGLTPKISDFGLSKILETDKKISDDKTSIVKSNKFELSNSITQDGQFFGTPGYASPEQIGLISSLIGENTDIYAFGVILCELITGLKPNLYKYFYDGVVFRIDPNSLIENVDSFVLDFIKKLRPDCPEKLISLIIKCLQVNPTNRWKREKIENKFAGFETISDSLKEIYKELINETYSYSIDYIHPFKMFEDNEYLIHNFKGVSFLKLKKYNEALKYFDRAIKLNPNAVIAHTNRGAVLSYLGRDNEAISSYDVAIQINPDEAAAWYNQGNSFKKLGIYDKAIEKYKKAIRLNPSYKEAYNNLGLILNDLSKYEEAIFYYDKAIEINPIDVKSLTEKGISLMKIGKPSEAKDYFDKAIKIDSNYVKSYVNKGIIFLDEKNYDMALSLFKKAIELDKEDVEAHSNMGVTLGQLKRYSGAIDSFDEALKLQPENGYIHYNKSLALSILERYIEATEHWNLYLKFKNNQGQFTADLLKVEE